EPVVGPSAARPRPFGMGHRLLPVSIEKLANRQEALGVRGDMERETLPRLLQGFARLLLSQALQAATAQGDKVFRQFTEQAEVARAPPASIRPGLLGSAGRAAHTLPVHGIHRELTCRRDKKASLPARRSRGESVRENVFPSRPANRGQNLLAQR